MRHWPNSKPALGQRLVFDDDPLIEPDKVLPKLKQKRVENERI